MGEARPFRVDTRDVSLENELHDVEIVSSEVDRDTRVCDPGGKRPDARRVSAKHTTEPILRPFRKILPPQKTGGIDLSPILVILLILFLKVFLSNLFLNAARAF